MASLTCILAAQQQPAPLRRSNDVHGLMSRTRKEKPLLYAARISSNPDSSLGAWFAVPIAATHGSLSSSCSKRADQKITLPFATPRICSTRTLPFIAKANLFVLILLAYAYALLRSTVR
jgi:hypothetical protein